MTFGPLRSVLFVPGSRPGRFQKALDAGADAVIFDLEDAVEANAKMAARDELDRFLKSAPPSSAAKFVRINAAGSAWHDDDLNWLAGVVPFVDAIVVSKVERAADLDRVASVAPDRGIIPMLETARGVLHAPEILAVSATIPAAIFGAEDLTAELGIPRTLDGEELLYPRSRVVLAAATIGADPIDAVWVRLTDAEGLRKDATRARALGFRGKTAIHPEQLAIITEVFTPTAGEVEQARRIVEADERARTAGEGAFRLNDEMVDAPVVSRARRVLAAAGRLKHLQ